MHKKLLVTGSKGQLAKSFLKLFSNNYKIFYYDKNTLDISSCDKVKKILNEIQPEVILNCAAFTNVDLCEDKEDLAYELNANSIKNFSGFDGHFFHISTDYVFSMGQMVLIMKMILQIQSMFTVNLSCLVS